MAAPATTLDPTKEFIDKQQAKRLAGDFKPVTGGGAAGGSISASVTPAVVNIPETPVVAPADTPIQTTTPVNDPSVISDGVNNYNVDTKESTPVTPVVPVADPVIEPKPTTKTTTDKTEVPIDYNKSTGRENEISDNLTRITGQDPGLLTDRTRFNDAFGYSTADGGKKALLDSFFAGKQPNADSIFQGIIAGQSISNTLPGYKEAKLRADNYQRYSGYTADQFASSLRSGDLLPGTQAYNDLVRIPDIKLKIDKARALNQINGDTVDTTKVVEKTMTSIVDNTPFGQALKDGVITADEANGLTSTPEIKQAEGELLGLRNEVSQKKNLYDNIRVDVDRELNGRGISKSEKEAIIANRQRDLLGPYNLAIDLYNNKLGSVTDMKKQAVDLFDTNIGLYRERKAAEDLKMQRAEDKAFTSSQNDKNFQNQKDLATYQADLGLKTKQAEFEQQIAQKAQIAKDPVLATQDIIDTYKKMGVMAGRSDAEIIQSVKNDIANGMTLGQSLTNLNKAFQSKDVYKAVIAKATNIPGSDSKWTKLTDTSILNTSTGEIRSGTVPTSTSTYTGPTDAVSFIASKEGFREQAYDDATGKPLAKGEVPVGKATIGYGFTNVDGKPVQAGDTMSREKADSMFASKVAEYTNYKNFVKVPLTPSQETALNSFEYNLGQGIWTKANGGAQQVINHINNGDFAAAGREMQKFNTARGGIVLSGLTARRADEAKLLAGTDSGAYNPSLVPLYKKYGSKGGESAMTAADWKVAGDLTTFTNGAKAYFVDAAKNEIPTLEKYAEDLKYLRDNAKYRFPGNAITDSKNYKKYVDYSTRLAAVRARTSLQNLIDLKSNGATFGSLSNQELNFITDAAITGNLTVWGEEGTYKSELDKIIKNAELGIKNVASGNIFGNTKYEAKAAPMTSAADQNGSTGVGTTLGTPNTSASSLDLTDDAWTQFIKSKQKSN